MTGLDAVGITIATDIRALLARLSDAGAFDAEHVLDNGDDWWKDCAQHGLDWWARTGTEFSSEDLTLIGVPDPDHANRWGALFRAAHTRGSIEPVGWQTSNRPSRHGGVVRVWRGAGKAA